MAITTLPTAAVVESVMFGDHVAEAFAPGAVWAQIGTIGVEATEQTGARLAEIRPDLLFVDAPVSGSKRPAEQGQPGPDNAGPARQLADTVGVVAAWAGIQVLSALSVPPEVR